MADMRLIDANEALRMIENSKADCPVSSGSGVFLWGKAHNCVVSCVEAAPTIDAAPVVYCSKCLHHNRCISESNYLSENIENPYCCRGERKDGDGK